MRVRRILLSFMGLFDFNRGEEPEEVKRWRGVRIIAPLEKPRVGATRSADPSFSTGAASDKAARPTLILSE